MPTYIDTTNLSPATISTLQGPIITQIQITTSAYVVKDDTAVSTTGGYIKITGANFTAGTQVVIGTAAATSVTFVNTTTLNVQVPAQSAGTYVVYVTTNTGSVAILVNGLTYSGDPAWVTGSTLTAGQVDTPISIQLSATGDAPVTYVLQAGSSLPPGVTLSSGGLLSGTVTGITSETVYNFTIEAIDAQAQESPRTFSITISANDQYFEYVTSLLSAATPTSTFVTDASTNGFAVTVNGDTRPSNFGPYTPGYYSNFFDGTGDYLTAPNNTAFDFGSGDFTLETYIYPTIVSGEQHVYGKRASNANFAPIIFGVNAASGTNRLFIIGSLNNSSWGIGGTTGSIVIPLNQFSHIAVVRSGTTIYGFVNGVLDITITNISGALMTNSDAISIGASGTNGTTPFTGYISNFRIVKGTAVYTSNFTPSTTPLTAIANTSLLTCQSNRFIDNSTNNFTITRNGDTRVDSFDPFLPDSNFAGRGSGYFDGSGDTLSLSADACPRGTEDFTIEFWYYPLSLSSAERYFVVGDGSNALIFGITYSGNDIGVIRNVSGAGVVNFGSRTQLTVNAWNYIAVTRSGTTFRCYINGNPTTTPSGTSDYSFATPSATVIGAGSTFGNITDLRIVRGTALYTGATMTVPAAPLTAVANTSLLTLQNSQPNNNSMFLDSSTNNFNITRNGNTTQGTFSPYGGGWSNYFDGSGDYLTIPYSASLVQWWDTNYTIEMWIYNRANAASGSVPLQVAHGIPTASETYWAFGTNAAGNLSWYYWNGSGNNAVSTSTVPLNTWTHVAMVYNNTTGTLKGYINGVEAFSVAKSGTPQSSASNTLNMGKVQNVDYTGYISNLRIVRGTMVYTGAFTPPTAPLTPIANTQLLTCADNRFIDDSPNNFTVTRSGDTSIQRFNPFNPVLTTPTSYSGFFDGTGDKLTLPSSSNLAFGTGDFCVEAWTYFNANPADRMIFGNISNSETQFSFRIDSSGFPKVQSWFTNYAISSTAVVTNQWYHLVACRVSNTLSIFINGTRTATATVSNNFSSTDAFEIGGKVGNDFVNGYISNLRVTKGSSPYNPTQTTITVPATPLTAIANTQLLTLQSPTFVDNSTNNFTITAVGDTAPRQFNPFGWTSTTGSSAAYTPALYGGSGYFDGTGDYLSLTQSALAMGTGNFTIECWAYISGSVSNSGIWQLAATLFPGSVSGLSVAAVSGAWQIIYGGTTASGGTAALNTWYHLALVRSETNLRLYVNGISVISVTDSTNYTGTAITIGAYYTSGYPMTGYVSDMRITAGVARYTSNFQPPIAPLTALPNTVLLNNMTGAGIYDSSMMNDYETVGNSSISTSIKKYGNSSMYFDGSGDYLVSSPDPNLSFGTSDFTVEMWVYLNSGSAYQYVIGATANGGMQIGLNVPISGTPTIAVATANGSWILNFGRSITIPSATWSHIAVTRSGSTNRAFINGVQLGSSITDSTNWTFPNNRLQVGATLGAESFAGYIDDLRITRGVARYTTTFTPPTSPYIRF